MFPRMLAGGVVWLAVLLAPAHAHGQEASPPEAFLAMGVEQLADGDFEAAVFSLDTAVRRFQARPGDAEALVRAYVYLGAAYVGLGHAEAAKGKFREALERKPELRLRAEEFPPNVIKVFEAQLIKMTAARKKKSGTIALALGGAGAAGAAGVAAVTRDDRPPANRAPTVGIDVTPAGQAIAGVTVLSFSGMGRDPDANALTYRWDFGDGGQALTPTATHQFAGTGTFRVVLTVDDGQGGRAAAEVSIDVSTLSGRWVAGRWMYTLLQNGSVLSGTLSDAFGRFIVTGTVTHPRDVAWTAVPEGGTTTDYRFTGIADERLERIAGPHRDETFRSTSDVVLTRQ